MRIYKSESISFAAGGRKVVPLAFLPDEGPMGGHLVISHLIIDCTYQFDTGSGVTVTGAGLAGVIDVLRVYDAEGDRVNLKGPHVRAFHIWDEGDFAVADPSAIAQSQTDSTGTYYHVVSFAPRRARRRYDYCLPVRNLKAGGGIEIQMPSAAGIGFSGGTPTVDAITYTVYAYCREESDLEVKTRTERRYVTLVNRTDNQIPINGNAIRSMFLFKAADHATGGTDISSITAVTCTALNYDNIDPLYLRLAEGLEAQRNGGSGKTRSTADPFVQTTERAIALVWPRLDGKITEMPRKEGELMLRLTGSSVDNIEVVMELVTARSVKSQAGELALTAGATKVQTLVKTASKTGRDVNGWRKAGLASMMPAKLVVSGQE